MQPSCDVITGSVFRPLFGLELATERLEEWVLQTYALSGHEVQRRQHRDLLCLDWEKDGVRYTAGLQNGNLLFASIRFEAGQVSAGQVITCLGAPEQYQAWCDSYAGTEFSSAHITLVFIEQMAIAYGSQHFSSFLAQAPSIDDGISIGTISIFGKRWDDEKRILAKSLPWPGSWRDVYVEMIVHPDIMPRSKRNQGADALPPTAIPDVLTQIAAAFAHAPRPSDEDLLHPQSQDDSEIQALLGVPHWREMPDDAVEYEYSALAFLGPAGFRHFLPAYMSWALRHPESGAAVVGATIFSLTPAREGPQREFMLSKYSLLDAGQREAVVAFLRVMANYEEVAAALDYWLP